jgi:hypothetical protein
VDPDREATAFPTSASFALGYSSPAVFLSAPSWERRHVERMKPATSGVATIVIKVGQQSLITYGGQVGINVAADNCGLELSPLPRKPPWLDAHTSWENQYPSKQTHAAKACKYLGRVVRLQSNVRKEMRRFAIQLASKLSWMSSWNASVIQLGSWVRIFWIGVGRVPIEIGRSLGQFCWWQRHNKRKP